MVRSGFAAALAPGTVISGKYRIERVLGKGGMGVVLAARHLDLNQTLAIKVLLPTAAASEEAITRFVREGRSAAQLTSPHVAKVHDTGHLESGEPYLVMELLNGSDLRVLLTEVGWVPLAKAIAWVLQAAHALAEAHKLSIIHRDIKPANLFLAETSTGEQIKVLDFGVSKQLGISDDLTSTMATVGTPRYMAPEQMRSSKLADARGDIWSLGVVLYELTTGQHPFHGDSVTAICFDVMERTPTPPSQINPALPPVFDEVIARCLEKNPDDRFQSIQELATALYAVAPDSARFSGFFNAPSSEPSGAVAAATPVPAITPDPTGPTKIHPLPARPSQPGVVASPDPSGPTRLHPQSERYPRAPQPEPYPQPVPVPPPLTLPVAVSPPLQLHAQEMVPAWNTSAQPRSGMKRLERSRLIALAGGVAITTSALVIAGLASRRHALSAHDTSSASPPLTSPPLTSPPTVALSSAPNEPMVVALDPQPLSSSAPVAPSSAPSAVVSSQKPIVGSPPTGPIHSPTTNCYSFDERGHKHVNSWCR